MNTLLNRPYTTLFMLMSVDGKISTGATDEFDFDKDLPNIPYIKDGIYQYYEIEKTTDIWSMISGKVLAKIGANTNKIPDKTTVNHIIFDNSNLNELGVNYMSKKANKLIILTSNTGHPAYHKKYDNVYIEQIPPNNMEYAFRILKTKYEVDSLTIQTGGTLNEVLIRHNLVDKLDIVVAPILIGGKDVPTLIDGNSIKSINDIYNLTKLQLENVKVLENSYLRLTYSVIK